MWKDFSEHPRRAHPPVHLVSREAMKDDFRSMISIVKNSDSYHDFMNLHINKNMTVA